ncbi:cytidine deaminase [Fervidobacterium pennivorans subsp. shakshaketiis]|jgi:cytidine deaminase|uniref:Cytidine deaminase n=1 Tax=Fervidobacterium pennivorans (strain DSM 9078 / Ven5) TaxID=771875 RepID=H9UCI7_FERPD|nr:cytidine deaminase [Fervidobacterium pennivorans]AFG35230.1 cytidine deaminase, homotetrameric [Fervidobacterium pennivorans DSM 9078]QIV78406.1 cytidine deaminase [Fervidobacterium pennivorans subsp. keratinolyticus]
MRTEELIQKAKEAMKNAYAPYSQFHVGAALLTKSGKVYIGANVENASYGLTNCAERTAIFSAVANGEREFDTLVVIADTEKPVAPCGACRQVMAEFGNFKVILTNLKGEVLETTVSELLPYAFDKGNLRGKDEHK